MAARLKAQAGRRVPAASLAADEAAEHFGRLAPFVGMDMRASSAWTRERLDWRPEGPSLIEDLEHRPLGWV